MELIRKDSIRVFASPGIASYQLLFPENSTSRRLTITRVVFARGARNELHQHATSEQVWVALEGRGAVLLAGEREMSFQAGDVVRFEEGEMHGLKNTGSEPFVYLAVTAPPLNFRAAYREERSP